MGVLLCICVCLCKCVCVFLSVVLGEVSPSLLCFYIKKMKYVIYTGSLLERKIFHMESFSWIYHLRYSKSRFFSGQPFLDHNIDVVYLARFYLLALR